jgi:hypothetical protein
MASWLASPWSLVYALFVWYLHAFIKCWLGAALSLPAWAVSGENPGRLLEQPVLYAEPALLAGCHFDPWDASQQVTLPLAYPGGHPHNTEQVPFTCFVIQYHLVIKLTNHVLASGVRYCTIEWAYSISLRHVEA